MYRRLNHSKGFTLIELMVAVSVLAIAMMATWTTIQAAQNSLGSQLDRILAHQVALNRVAELRLIGMTTGRSLASKVRQGPFLMSVAVKGRAVNRGMVAVEIVVNRTGSPGARVMASVPD